MTTLGVIGLGRIGAFHTETLSGLDGLDGLVITDERSDVAEAVAAKHGVKAVATVDELLSSGVDGVVVAAATPAHAELTLAAVERGIPTFCEKPIASTAAESARVAEVILKSGVPVQVGYQRRFDAAFAAAKRAVDDGSLGILHTVRSTTMDPAPPPMDYIKGSGGIFRDCAVHDFDVLNWITGQRAVEVYATGTVQGDPLFTEYDDVDTAAVIVKFDGGALGVVSAARYNARGYDCRLEIHGFDDSVAAGWDQGVPLRNTDSRNDFPTGPSHHFFMDRFTEAFRTELAAFVGVTKGEAIPGATVADAVEVAWLAEAATESLRRARTGHDRGGAELVSAIKIAGAPISWGVCEVPGWGYQLAPDRVLTEMRGVGLTATELGPDGFLPTDTDELKSVLRGHDLACVGGFVPVVLFKDDHDPADDLAGPLESLVAAGAGVVVLAAATGSDGYDSRPVLDDAQWATLLANLDRLATIVVRPWLAGRPASARRHHGGNSRGRGPGAGGVVHPAVPGHRALADRRHRSAGAGQSRTEPHRPYPPQGRRRRTRRQGAVRRADLHRRRPGRDVHPAGLR